RAEPRVVELVGPACIVEEPCGDERHIDITALFDRFTVVEALGDRELSRTLLHETGDAKKVLAPVATTHLRPHLRVGATGSGNGRVDIVVVRARNGRDTAFVRRRNGVERCTAAIDELAVDEEAVAVFQ